MDEQSEREAVFAALREALKTYAAVQVLVAQVGFNNSSQPGEERTLRKAAVAHLNKLYEEE